MNKRLFPYKEADCGGSSVYGFWIDYVSRYGKPVVQVHSCELFDRDTYEEFSACAEINAASFVDFLRACLNEENVYHTVSDEKYLSTVSAICKDGFIREIHYSGNHIGAATYPEELDANQLLSLLLSAMRQDASVIAAGLKRFFGKLGCETE